MAKKKQSTDRKRKVPSKKTRKPAKAADVARRANGKSPKRKPQSRPAPSVAAKKKKPAAKTDDSAGGLFPGADGTPASRKQRTVAPKPAGAKSAAAGSRGGKRPIEQYEHPDKKRANNPPVGLVNAATDPVESPKKTYQYDPHLDPQLVWAGKTERTSFEVPSVSLHVHERIDPKTIIAAVRTNGDRVTGAKPRPAQQMSLFESPDANPPLRDALDFYKHPHGWTNRLIAGDSLLVMNSLLDKEGMAGKVQMIYIDPPYGIRYGSNFQPFVDRRDVKDGKDDDLTQEPETLRAFRDTWELGVHSYLTYLRDRLLLAHELLNESGSVFVQISDENLHLTRQLLDEVFGQKNHAALVAVRKTAAVSSPLAKTNVLPTTCDYLVWYARDLSQVKYRPLYLKKAAGEGSAGVYSRIEMPDGVRRKMTREENDKWSTLPQEHRIFRLDNLTSTGWSDTLSQPIEYDGSKVGIASNLHWKTTPDGMRKLINANRVVRSGSSLAYIRFLDDFPVSPLGDVWLDTGSGSFTDPKVYVVQTNTKVVQRCILMTTDPGDLVFDPTCGSGTTAFVAEQWGRRWITCDTSRVAVTLAKQRLMTAVFDYYRLGNPPEGIHAGFVYKTVPHVTLKSIANNPDIKEGMGRAEIDSAIKKHADQETLYDQPEPDKSKARVTGPFTVEAVPAINVRPLEEVTESRSIVLDPQQTLPGLPGPAQPQLEMTADTSVARYGETARQRQWRDELQAAGVRGKGGQKLLLARLEPCPVARWLHALGETKDIPPKPVAVSFGPEFAPLEQRQVQEALSEAQQLHPRPEILLFAAFQFDPEAAKDIDEINPKLARMTPLRVQMNTDLLTDDLKKKRASNESFWLMGQPDAELRQLTEGADCGLWQIELHGFDYYNPLTGEIESGDTSRIAMWLLDPDYDGRSLYPRQVFFPLASDKGGWARLAKNLKAEIDEELIEAYRGTESLPFAAGKHQRAAVKIVDDRGIESLKIIPLAEGAGR